MSASRPDAVIPDAVIDLDLPGGGRVRTSWTAPARPGIGWAWVQHGFSRRGRDLAGLALLLSRAGIAVVRPDIGSWTPRRSLHDARWLTSVALTIGRAVEVGIPQARGVDAEGPWALVGHSAGGAVAVHAAACLGSRVPGGLPVSALVLLDPVDTVGGLLADALASTSPGSEALLPVVRRHVHALRPSRCNRHGATVEDLQARGWPVIRHPGLSHPDPERIPADAAAASVPEPAPWLGLACGEPGSAADVAALGRQVRDDVLQALGSPP